VAANLPDSEKVKRLQKALDGHIRLHADMKEEVKSKTDEVEHRQNEIANLRQEMEAKDEQLRAQDEEIQVLTQRVKDKEQEIEEKLQSIEHFRKEQRDRQQRDQLGKAQDDLHQQEMVQHQLQQEVESLELKFPRQQGTRSTVPPSQASPKYDDLPTGTDPMVEIATLKQIVQSKDQKIESLQARVHSFESVIQEQEKLLGHTKEPSKQELVLKLRQELEAAKVLGSSIKQRYIPS